MNKQKYPSFFDVLKGIIYLPFWLLKIILISLVRLYQKALSPLLPRACRFHPTCSEYFIQALRKEGLVKGLVKACWRILRCNPFHEGGYDPVEKNVLDVDLVESEKKNG